MKVNLALSLENRARNAPSLEAFVNVDNGGRHSFSELDQLANRCAALLGDLGIKPGERIALLQQNSVEFVALFFAAARIGAVVVPLNTRLAVPELDFILGDSGASLLISDLEFADTVAALRDSKNSSIQVKHWLVADAADESGLATRLQQASTATPTLYMEDNSNLFIMYTSGTTGSPKGVVHSHESISAAASNWMATMDARFADRIFLPLPMFHVAALNCVMLAVLRGMTIVAMPKFDPSRAWEVMETERITIGGSVPAVLNFMRQMPGFETFKAEYFRFFITGAAPMPAPLIELYNAKGMEVVQGYALTESGGGGSFLMNEFAVSKAGSAGTPTMFTEVRLLTEEGELLSQGQGEIVMRGSHMMKEYWNRPDANAEAWIDGWFRTGDVADIDADGFITIRDRIKDMIISGGENVYPAEVESVIQGNPDIADVAVIGQPDERWGEVVCAVVVAANKELTEDAVIAFCDSRLSRYKQPRRVIFVEALPRNASGKVLKKELRTTLGSV